ncbi:MAG: hypothetical protein ABJO67_03390 [Pseudoruegeria sp.]
MSGFNKADLQKFERRMKSIVGRDVPEIQRLALNDMAFAALAENKVLMKRVFDKPTPFTLNSFYVEKATKEKLTAVLQRKDFQSGKHYLEVQQKGGRRKMGGFEKLLQRRTKYEGIIQSVLPTKALRRNKYGNISPGTLQRMLSGVRAQNDAAQNTTAASRKRAGNRRAAYFIPRAGSNLSGGVYERRGKKIRKVLAFSDAVPSYSKRFPMEEHAEGVARDAAPESFNRAFARVMKRSGPS